MTQAQSDISKMQAAAPATPKLVKIKTLMPILVAKGNDKVSVPPGQIVEVSEDEAKEFADRLFTGGFAVSGEHSDSFAEANRHRYKRAERVN